MLISHNCSLSFIHPVTRPLAMLPVRSLCFLSARSVSCPLALFHVRSLCFLSARSVTCPLALLLLRSPCYLSTHHVTCPLAMLPVRSLCYLSAHHVTSARCYPSTWPVICTHCLIHTLTCTRHTSCNVSHSSHVFSVTRRTML